MFAKEWLWSVIVPICQMAALEAVLEDQKMSQAFQVPANISTSSWQTFHNLKSLHISTLKQERRFEKGLREGHFFSFISLHLKFQEKSDNIYRHKRPLPIFSGMNPTVWRLQQSWSYNNHTNYHMPERVHVPTTPVFLSSPLPGKHVARRIPLPPGKSNQSPEKPVRHSPITPHCLKWLKSIKCRREQMFRGKDTLPFFLQLYFNKSYLKKIPGQCFKPITTSEMHVSPLISQTARVVAVRQVAW